MENVITGLSKGAEWFIGLFQKGGEQFIGLVSGTLPTLIVLMVAINSLIKIIGEERVNNWASKLGKNSFTRYILLPLVSVFFLGNPMCYTFGRFLKKSTKQDFMMQQFHLYIQLQVFFHMQMQENFCMVGNISRFDYFR